MQFKLLTAALLSAVALAEPALEERQVSYPPAISTYISEVNVLVNSYLLNPQASSVVLSAVAAASITDLSSLITATAYPTALVSALPPAYQPGFNSFLAVVSSLRENAFSAAGLLSTITSGGVTSTTTTGSPTGSTSTSGGAGGAGGAGGSGSSSSSGSSGAGSSQSLTTTTSQTVVTSVSTGSSTTATVLHTSATTITSTVSRAQAVPTSVVNVAAGLVGLLGIALAL